MARSHTWFRSCLTLCAAHAVLLIAGQASAQALVYPEALGGEKAKAAPAITAKDLKPVVPAISGAGAASSSVEEQAGIQFAILQGTNKVTARTTRLEVPIGTLVRFGNLEVVVQKCDTTLPPARREQAALLDVWELKPSERPEQVYYGWMFASSPSLSSLQHAVYDLTLLECVRKEGKLADEGDAEAPAAEKSPAKEAPAKAPAKAAPKH